MLLIYFPYHVLYFPISCTVLPDRSLTYYPSRVTHPSTSKIQMWLTPKRRHPSYETYPGTKEHKTRQIKKVFCNSH